MRGHGAAPPPVMGTPMATTAPGSSSSCSSRGGRQLQLEGWRGTEGDTPVTDMVQALTRPGADGFPEQGGLGLPVLDHRGQHAQLPHLGPQQPGAPLDAALDKHLQRGRGPGADQAEAVGQLLTPAAAACGEHQRAHAAGQALNQMLAARGMEPRRARMLPCLRFCRAPTQFVCTPPSCLYPPDLRPRSPDTPDPSHLSGPRSALWELAPPTRSPRGRR